MAGFANVTNQYAPRPGQFENLMLGIADQNNQKWAEQARQKLADEKFAAEQSQQPLAEELKRAQIAAALRAPAPKMMVQQDEFGMPSNYQWNPTTQTWDPPVMGGPPPAPYEPPAGSPYIVNGGIDPTGGQGSPRPQISEQEAEGYLRESLKNPAVAGNPNAVSYINKVLAQIEAEKGTQSEDFVGPPAPKLNPDRLGDALATDDPAVSPPRAKPQTKSQSSNAPATPKPGGKKILPGGDSELKRLVGAQDFGPLRKVAEKVLGAKLKDPKAGKSPQTSQESEKEAEIQVGGMINNMPPEEGKVMREKVAKLKANGRSWAEIALGLYKQLHPKEGN
jgi:hypothetical protein